MTIQEVIEGIIHKSGVTLAESETCDHLMTGNAENDVTSIVTTFMATVGVIQRAVDLGANFIITHEPTWYTGADNTKWLENDPVYIAKKKLIEDHGIAIWRFHDRMHMATDGDGILRGFGLKMGWQDQRIPYKGEKPEFGAIYEFENTTLGDIAEEFHEKLHMNTIQIVGNPAMTVHRAGAYVGGGSLGLGVEELPMEHMRENGIDLAICGDITGWTLVPYIRDCQAVGIQKAMLILGHEKSEEMGMEYLGGWLKDIAGNIPIHFVDSGEPFRYLTYGK